MMNLIVRGVKNSKLLQLSFVCLTLLLGTISLPVEAHVSADNEAVTTSEMRVKGSIIMTGTILRVVMNNPKESIKQVTVKDTNGLVLLQLNGCDKHNCSYDISDLAAGNYLVTVTVSKEEKFSKVVEKKK